MIHVFVKKEITCPVKATDVKSFLPKFLESEGLVSDAEVSVTFVGKAKMLYLAKKYLGEKGVLHNVLSFPFAEGGEFVNPPDNIIRLGDIVVCYPKLIEEVKDEGVLIDDKVRELVCHGGLHLLGKHHKE